MTKLLIFSEYRDTLDYLEENIAKMPAVRTGRHMRRLPHRRHHEDGTTGQQLPRRSSTHGRTPSIMLATDAAREGINLQFRCHRMVNYDLPMDPDIPGAADGAGCTGTASGGTSRYTIWWRRR